MSRQKKSMKKCSLLVQGLPMYPVRQEHSNDPALFTQVDVLNTQSCVPREHSSTSGETNEKQLDNTLI